MPTSARHYIGTQREARDPLASEHVLRQKGVEFHTSNRGGDITYHEPGLIVGNPILNLARLQPMRTVRAYAGRSDDPRQR